MQFIVSDRQTLLDAAVIALGSVAGVFALAQRNDISITVTLADGLPLIFELEDVVAPAVRSAYAVQHISPATDIPRADYLELLYQTGTRRPPVAQKFDPDNVGIVVDKIDEVIADLNAGRPLNIQSKNELTRIFQDPFDEVFS